MKKSKLSSQGKSNLSSSLFQLEQKQTLKYFVSICGAKALFLYRSKLFEVNTVEVDNWTRNEIEGEELIRSTAANDDDDSADDSNSDPSDYLSDCEQDDLV
ncbi:hypothetical protein C5167_044170 [Papaver somniferum]|uniref:Uncharacterized protein n=1 Tax=Papaver somniferum TaxID=3469 RepID=A0A4Y7L9D1_PAPSO|nr:hypothetical protein C5167_044170 [Papaver somniferum]